MGTYERGGGGGGGGGGFSTCSIAEITYFVFVSVLFSSAVSRGDVLIGLWALHAAGEVYNLYTLKK